MKKIIFALSFALYLLTTSCASNNLGESVKNTGTSTTPVQQDAKWAVKWWMPRHQEKLAQKEQLGDVQLVFLGDSITHAWDRQKKTWDQYYAGRKALNLGFSGDRTEHVLWRLDHGAVDGINPKALVLMIGTNNAGHNKEASAETAKGVKAILQELRVRLPETKILMLAIFPRGKDDNDALRKLTMGTNEIIKTYADNKDIFFLNINAIFLDDKRILHKNIMNDLLHPNNEMYPKWAEAIEPKLVELMQD
ncbi:GDSL-type esterase/lipase family protein [Lentisphaera profundi]|uniref:GDSL-type esterase/lipase family protein n=1 Tax=Lentisphaera profundi TaxID=1658616 RepID=A0ABY7VSX4_9BACT|nr:GDSL-type esterase/lipase family protein [Lentisphaera profundi]WDE96368.1 GDSL-type esterase/lipase family protein [Lentisphaera profundi]